MYNSGFRFINYHLKCDNYDMSLYLNNTQDIYHIFDIKNKSDRHHELIYYKYNNTLPKLYSKPYIMNKNNNYNTFNNIGLMMIKKGNECSNGMLSIEF